MDEKIVYEKVRAAISSSCGIEIEKITPESTLFNDLGITSIDVVDIMYTLETEFNITLNVSEIESEAREELLGASFEVDNVITKEGLIALKKRLPEIPEDKLKNGLTIFDIVNLITVNILCKMIIYKLNKNADSNVEK